jgi:hypothetical protein
MLGIKHSPYVKDQGSSLNVMTNALKLVVSCEFFYLKEIF